MCEIDCRKSLISFSQKTWKPVFTNTTFRGKSFYYKVRIQFPAEENSENKDRRVTMQILLMGECETKVLLKILDC